MSDRKVTRRVYSAEELQNLRSSCSAPKLSEAIEEHVMEDAELVKDHVLRGSRSFAARSFRSRNGFASIRIPSDRTNNENVSLGSSEHTTQAPLLSNRQPLEEVSGNNQGPRAIPDRLRPSPTPSLKRKKAEAIVRAHGSPTHVRVTAGGRIVPSEQSPLCLPRYGYSAVKANGGLIKFAPNHHVGKTLQWGPTAQDGSQNGFVAQDVEGRLYQIVNGTILPLNEVDGSLRLYMPAPNLNITERDFTSGNMTHMQTTDMPSQSARAKSQPSAPQPPIAAQISALELEYAKYEHELKDLDKTEVIHGKSMGKPAKEALVTKRRELVMTMDKVRKATKALKERPASVQQERPQTPKIGSDRSFSSPSMLANQRTKQNNPAPMPQHQYFGQPPFLQHPGPFGPGPMPASESSFMGPPFMMSPMGYFMYPPPFDGPASWAPPYQPFPGFAENVAHPAMPPTQALRTIETAVPQNDGAASAPERVHSPRQSHALALKDPDTKQVINVKSLLNPMSPVYKPPVDGTNRSARSSEIDHKNVKDRPPTPLSFAHLESAGEHSQQSTRHTTATSSGSSIRTMDFFPHNTREHSTRKHEYPTTADESENKAPRDSARGSSDNSQADYDRHDADWNPKIPARTFIKAAGQAPTPNAPPGTPIADNTPKNGHDKVFGHRHSHFLPGGTAEQAVHNHQSHDGASSVSGSGIATIDFSNKSRQWIEGYQAGFFRRAVGAHTVRDFVDGYCSGLIKSQSLEDNGHTSSSARQSEDSSIPAIRQQTPLELARDSKDCLKEAIYSPSNEDAILTPALDGPSIEDNRFNLGAWQKQHDFFMSASGQGLAEFPFPHRTSSVAQVPRKNDANVTSGVAQDGKLATDMRQGQSDMQTRFANLNLDDKFAFGPAAQHKDTPNTVAANEVVSAKERPNMFNQGKRIISPLEWRTRNSLANVVNMTSNLFALDGQPGDKSSYSDREPMLPGAADISGSAFSHEAGSRFKEGSLDGISPAISPVPLSPPVSPRSSPVKLFRSKETPTKQSPTKARLEHLVSKVGIKVSPEKIPGNAGSPNGKRHWKDLWKGSRTLSGKHDAI